MKSKGYLTTNEVSEYLRQSPCAIIDKIRRGEFGQVTRLGTRGPYRITPEQVEAYIEANTGQPYQTRQINVRYGRRGAPRSSPKLA